MSDLIKTRKGIFIPDITVEMFRNASLEAVEELLVSGEMQDIILPSAEPERKKGKWLAYGEIPTTCPYCHEDWDKYVYGDVWYSGELPNYCPNCGEEVRGEQDED